MSRRIAGQPFAADETSASEVVAFVLVTAIVIVAITGIILAAGPQLAAEQENVQVGQAEQGLTQFDDEAFRVAVESAAARTVDIGLRGNSGTLDVEPESGNITVKYKEDPLSTNRTELLNTSLGTVVYEEDDTTVAYQGGGVWRSDGSGSVMVSPPEISYDGKTLTMPIVTAERSGSVHSNVLISPQGPSEQKFPNASAADLNLTNKVNTGTLWITIESRYYQAWGQYFEEETGAIVQYPGGDRVVVIFLGSSFSLSQDTGIIATSGPGEIRIEGNDPYIDSYNSGEGPYDGNDTSEGIVKSAGNIDLSGGAEIRGDAESEGKILMSGTSNITGDACGSEGVENLTIGGDISTDGCNVPVIPPLDDVVELKDRELAENNDNNATSVIVDETLDIDAGETEELSPGQYYLEQIEFTDNETLVLNATTGPITLLVENYMTLKDGQIEVKGDNDDGTVRVYLASKEGSGEEVTGSGSKWVSGNQPADHLYVKSKKNRESSIDVKNDHSPRFQILAPSHFTGGIEGQSSTNPQVTGVLLAPTLGDGPSQLTVRDAELFGASITGNLSIENNAEIHFDRGILEVNIPFSEDTLLDYLYVTEHRIKVEGS